ncbi:Structural maintenance of chromosomes protein 5 [Citrus sinensis]|uniref:Structural maintenance of chromosomes protein 5 n=1 Tax=Citrus sinensis TaxID=2711 RepID=A0ACB8LLG5_CITSI|nr:Structural maintenance of chromosomes protein 5 [Citrus sinensis]
MDLPRVKRLKVSRGEDDYMPGNIIEIELHNFMTFDHLICKPGSRLNLVIGPNGSGKSSLVCAIALALGGDTQLLGRATSIGAYVKRGEESGYIKISLRGDTKEEHLTIMRKIDTRNKSEWFFNVPKGEVLEITKRFNIQVNNLTQFLPQDRVCEFAKLSPVKLLEETEKAVGDPQLPTVKRNGDTLNQLMALNVEQEKDVERVRQRAELLEKVESMKKKLPWLKYDMKKAEYIAAKEQEKDAKKKLDEAANTLHEFSKPIEGKKQEKAILDGDCKKLSSLINENSKRRMDFLEKVDQVGVQVQGKYKEMQELRRQEQSRQQRILKAREELAAAELDLQNVPAYEPPHDKIVCVVSNFDLLLSSGSARLDVVLKDMEDKNNKLLHALRNSGAENIFEAYCWLQQHRHELNKEAYGPVLLEVNVSNRAHANYLEDHVGHYIWKSFITQDAGDRDFLAKNLKPFDVPILNYVSNESSRKEPFQISEEMRALGISARLDQVFDAPHAVKEVLISQFGLDSSLVTTLFCPQYIGSKETDQKADNVAKLGILDFWTPENHYRWSISRYGGHVSASVEPVNQSRLLLCSVDGNEIERLRSKKKKLEESVDELEESLKSMQTEQRLIEDEAAKLQKEREEIINIVQIEKRKRREMENHINLRKRKLESIEKEDDINTALAKLVDQAADLNIQQFKYAIEIKNLLVEIVSCKWSYAEKHMASIEFDAKIRELEFNLKQHEKLALQASLHYEDCKKEVEHCRKHLSDAKRQAESIAFITPELEKEFLEMPTTIEELEAAIQDNISQANSIFFLNQNILQEYEHRQQQIEDLSTKQEADKKELKRFLAEIDALKEKWLPTLRNLVAQINETFSRNFQEMAVAGEVSLDEHESDFDKFGILIKVKFSFIHDAIVGRQSGQLEVLSAHHQSGGERSVSTILYLVSLQDLTNCPFRVVDEINQGMDPINERKMFQQLVRAASQPNTPQCFLLTPKLLPDLEYSEACSILNIMDGPWIEQPSKAENVGAQSLA